MANGRPSWPVIGQVAVEGRARPGRIPGKREVGRWHPSRLESGMKRVGIAPLGGSVLLVGLAMIVLPGPAIAVIPLALAILAVEFAWARRYLGHCRTACQRAPVPRRFKAWLRRRVMSARRGNRGPGPATSSSSSGPIPRWMP